jgi:carbon storage regulator
VLALERPDVPDGNLELVGDPGVGPALAHPGADLVQLGLQGPPCQSGADTSNGGSLLRPAGALALLQRTRVSRQGRPGVLVLTRKGNQSIMIGDDIEVSVLAIMGEKVRLGIEAPRSVPVFRKEVYIEIQQDREEQTQERYAS